MSRDERHGHVALETAEDAVHRGGAARRAEVEERLQRALAAGDRERVSELRQRLEALANG